MKISLERVPGSNCHWQGVNFPLYARRSDNQTEDGLAAPDALFYPPLFRPIPEKTKIAADDDRTVVLKLDPRVPRDDMAEACLDTGYSPEELRGAMTLPVYGVRISMREPYSTESCMFRPVGPEHQFSGEESIRIRFRDSTMAQEFVDKATGEDLDILLNATGGLERPRLGGEDALRVVGG